MHTFGACLLPFMLVLLVLCVEDIHVYVLCTVDCAVTLTEVVHVNGRRVFDGSKPM